MKLELKVKYTNQFDENILDDNFYETILQSIQKVYLEDKNGKLQP